MKIDGLQAWLNNLRDRETKARADYMKGVLVGYGAHYAIYVHENLEAQHPKGGNAKFLSGPLRRNAAMYRAIVKTSLKQGASMRVSLLRAGRQLKVDSQAECPIDKGVLVLSAFVRVF